MVERFEKPFTQQEAIPEAAIERVAEILRTGRLHRYNTVPGEVCEATLLEKEGVSRVANLRGGILEWRSHGFPIETPPRD